MATHWLIAGTTSASEVEHMTGLQGHNTHLGVLVKKPKPFDMEAAMRVINRALNPNACTCHYAIMHAANCPAWNVMT